MDVKSRTYRQFRFVNCKVSNYVLSDVCLTKKYFSIKTTMSARDLPATTLLTASTLRAHLRVDVNQDLKEMA